MIDLTGKRVFVTSADRHMGPAVAEVYEEYGAEVIRDVRDYTASPNAIGEAIADAGRIDILLAQFAGPLRLTPSSKLMTDVREFKDEDFQDFLDELVWPLLRGVRAVLPQMIERGSGKIVAITSASALRPIPGMNVYSAARGAANTFIRSVGAEVAAHNVQVNAIAPSFHESNFYFTDEMLDAPGYRDSLLAQIPAGRLGTERECGELAVALSGPATDFISGHIVPWAGGWA
jgi:2-keto-3-deoxy-L-fuconate dehydrogenase